jgi:tripartite-type tricarboxylate transporter receptor subunit TctC
MPTKSIGRRLATIMAVYALALSGAAQAGSYPIKPVRLIVGYTAGGASDVPFRALAQAASEILGQPIIVENRGGLGGAMPAQVVAASPADGYTLAQFAGPIFRLPYQTETSWNPIADFDYVIAVNAYSGSGLVVRSDSAFQTIDDYIAYAKANPGKLSYATPGVMTALHIMMEDLATTAGITLQHIPYKGDAEALPAVIGGHVMSAASTPAWRSYVDNGDMRLLLSFDDDRNPLNPDVPTIVERRLAQPDRTPLGIAVRKGTDPEIIRTLHDAFRQAMESPDFKQVLDKFNMMPAYKSSAEYSKYAVEKYQREKEIVSRYGKRVN